MARLQFGLSELQEKMRLTPSFCGIVTCEGKFYMYVHLQYIFKYKYVAKYLKVMMSFHCT